MFKLQDVHGGNMNKKINKLIALLVSASLFSIPLAGAQTFIFRAKSTFGNYSPEAPDPDDNLIASFPSTAFTVGVPASVQGSVSGATSPVTWTHQSGNLPNGLVFSSSGTLSGTPTTAGTFSNLHFKVTSNNGETNVGPVNLTVYSTLSVPPINVVVAKNMPIPPINISPAGGLPPYTASVETNELPNGLALSGLTVSGTIDLSAASTYYSAIVDVSDSRGQVASTMMNINVMGPLNISENAAPLPIYRGINYTYDLNALGGLNITPVSLDNPSAAPGLSMSFNWSTLSSQLTGLISSVPNLNPATGKGSTTLNFSASDALGQTATFSRTFEVWDMPSFGLDTNNAYETNFFNFALISKAAVEPFTYTVLSSLPNWIDFNGTGFTGSADAGSAGTYPVRIRLTDARGRSSEDEVNIVIGSAIQVDFPTDHNLNYGDSIDIPFTISGGTGDYSYSVTPANSGIEVDLATRRIYGTPTQGGAYYILFRDSGSFQISKLLYLNIAQPPVLD